MPLFLSESERAAFNTYRRRHALGADVFWALRNRALARAASPGLHGPEPEATWWFQVAEYLSDAAMAHALQRDKTLAGWLRDTALSIVRRPEDDWVGPPFRDHADQPPRGHLETAHLTWGVAAVLDLAPDVFTAAERDEISTILRDRAIPMCRRWMDQNNHLANWRCILNAGMAVAAAVLDDASVMEMAATEYRLCLGVLQDDGSYGESLQYANYAAYNLMLTREALVRRRPDFAETMPLTPYVSLPRWQAASLFYHKPLSGWGSAPRPRCANFNDCAAIFRPSGDLLLHIAARAKDTYPIDAGLARWLFDTLYEDLTQGPHHLATFGLVNDYGFLTVPLLPPAAAAITPMAAGLPETLAFSNGDVLARDAWGGRTTLAVRGGGDPLNGPGHLHGDLNHFILVHNQERLLVDPGHSCYRNLIHGLEGSTRTHNTCSFEIQAGDALGLQEDQHSAQILEQSRAARRHFDSASRRPDPPVDRGARRLLVERIGEVTIIGSEAAALYGPAVQTFTRFWLLCGAHALFVVDHIVCREPLRTRWHWLFNNRDGSLELKTVPPDRIVARRGRAGLKLFHLGGNARLMTPQHAFVHDAYHPETAQPGEGRCGSGQLHTWRETTPATERTVVHAIAMDGYGQVAGWHLRKDETGSILESPDTRIQWRLDIQPGGSSMVLRELGADQQWTIMNDAGNWRVSG